MASNLNLFYNKMKSPLEFNFDNLIAPPILSLLTVQDISDLHRIATSIKLSGKIKQKYNLIDKIMTARGFVKHHAGTNRVVYRFIENQTFVVKIAVDKVGLGDNPAEYTNQFLLKPFVTKVFEVSPCGTVGLFERVDPILSREEFLSIADDVFNLITKFFIGKYILSDFGTHYFMNWGIRRNGGGPVLLDFPYVYELDGSKLYCNTKLNLLDKNSPICGGELDYDDGFNNLRCTRCGKTYQASELSKNKKENKIIIKKGGKRNMKVKITIGDKVILDTTGAKVSNVIEEPVKEDFEEIESVQVTEDKKFVTDLSSRLDIEEEETKDIEKPSNSIFNKKQINDEESKCDEISEDEEVEFNNVSEEVCIDTQEEDVVESSDDKEETHNEEDDPVEKFNNFIDDYDIEDEEDDDDEDDYDHYLNNRQRMNIRNTKKPRRSNTDFSDF